MNRDGRLIMIQRQFEEAAAKFRASCNPRRRERLRRKALAAHDALRAAIMEELTSAETGAETPETAEVIRAVAAVIASIPSAAVIMR